MLQQRGVTVLLTSECCLPREIEYQHFRRYGNALVHFDKDAERRLRLKIDLYIVPTVSLLYLFCFIDRANIGKYNSPECTRLV
jgi:hypothetical protein